MRSHGATTQKTVNYLHTRLRETLKSPHSLKVRYYLVRKPLPSCLFPKTLTITARLQRTIILIAVKRGSEMWSLTLNKEHKLQEFQSSQENI
jgi:hypothetical protein